MKDIEDFETAELVEELESRNYVVYEDGDEPETLDEMNDDDLIDEIEKRGYEVYANPQKFPPHFSLDTNHEWREHLTRLLNIPYLTDAEEIANILKVKLL